MKIPERKTGWILVVGLLFAALAWGAPPELVAVSLDNPNLSYTGIRHVEIQPELVRFSRFDRDLLKLGKSQLGFNPDKARNTTGGVVKFRTDSPIIYLRFRPTPDLNRGSEFGAFVEGRFTRSYKFNRNQQELEIKIENLADGGFHLWELALPSFSNPELVGFEITEGAQLKPPAEGKQKVYVALGDSITHGTGQGSASHLTWPFILSRKLGFDLYNLAVGGSGVSVAAGRSLEEFNSIDLITILIGYNDWNGEGNTVEEFMDEYDQLLAAVHAARPDTPVFCISPLFTRRQVSKASGLPIGGFREAVRQLAEKWGATNPNIHFIAGESLSSEANLRTDGSTDPVHLSVDGAALLAESLYPVLVAELQ